MTRRQKSGLRSDANGYHFGFNGKEADTKSEWGDLTHYDYGFRIYNPSIARFLSVDPLSPDYPWYTPYQFAGNKPIYAIDLDGLEELSAEELQRIRSNPNPLLNPWHADNTINLGDAPYATSYNSLGIPRNSQYFWCEYQCTPLGQQALSQNNLDRIAAGRSPIVDDQWNNSMRQFGLDGTLDEHIHHHHVNKGNSGVPVPASKHTGAGYNEVNHGMHKREGPVNQTRNRVLKRAGRYANRAKGIAGWFDLAPLLLDSPQSPLYMFHAPGTGEENRAYPTNLMGEGDPAFYEYQIINEETGLRKLIYFNDYDYIDGEWRGVDPTGKKDLFDGDGKKINSDEMGLQENVLPKIDKYKRAEEETAG